VTLRASGSHEKAKNRSRTAGGSLFFCSPNRRRPRISAEKVISFADNLLEKQRKQQKR
jgi:hypothetical protein